MRWRLVRPRPKKPNFNVDGWMSFSARTLEVELMSMRVGEDGGGLFR